jgi:hypothetical protein
MIDLTNFSEETEDFYFRNQRKDQARFFVNHQAETRQREYSIKYGFVASFRKRQYL